jgi:mono/diheme cytochrome c family protein
MSMEERIVIAALALGLAGLCAPAAANAERGGLLYETRCNACHASSVHQRNARKAKSFDGLRAQVLRWSAEVGGGWSGDEIDDVTLYLNQRYYRFPCPQSVCKAARASLARSTGAAPRPLLKY